MDNVKNPNVNSPKSSTVAPINDINVKVETSHPEILPDNSKLVSSDESGNKNENIVSEKPESVSVSSPLEASKLVSLQESGSKNENIVSENPESVSIPSPSEATNLVSLGESGNKNIVSENPECVSIPSPSEAAELVSLQESGYKNENIVSENPKSVSIPSPSQDKNKKIVLENPESVSIPSPSVATKLVSENPGSVSIPSPLVATKLVSLGKSGNKNENIMPKNTVSELIPSPDKSETFGPRKEEKNPVSVLESAKKLVMKKGAIDTAAPIKSVKAAVSKFGGIVDWKAHKVQTVEKHKFLQEELHRANEDIPMYKTQSQSAEEAKNLVLKELVSTKRLIEELKLSLERAQTEEQQAKQDAELTKLRTEEMEKGIKGDASVAAKAQLEVARARHDTAITELKSVSQELQQLRKDYESLVAEKDLAIKRAKEADLASKEVEKTVEEITIELISKKELLELAHGDLLEAEEKRVGDSISREQEFLDWEKELKRAKEELERLKKEIISLRDLKSKLNISLSLLKNLKAELGAYMEDKEKSEEKTHLDILEAIELANKELSEVRANIEKATDEVNILKIAESSLNLELEEEKLTLKNVKQIEVKGKKIKSEILIVETREKEIRERLANLRNELQDASRENHMAKSTAEMAREELRKASKEADLAKAEASTIESRLLATKKEIEVAKASEKLALSAINAMRESTGIDHASSGVVLSLEEYYELSKRAHEAEEKANTNVSKVISQIREAKESETKSFKKLEEMEKEIVLQKDLMEKAIKKAEDSEKGKLGMEQELREWRKKGEIIKNQINVPSESDAQNITKSVHQRTDSSEYLSDINTETDTSSEVKTTKKKKRSIFPRFFMFLGRKKNAAKST